MRLSPCSGGCRAVSNSLLPPPFSPRFATAPPSTIQKPSSERNAVQSISEWKGDYRILGQNRHAANATAALVDILKTLAHRDPKFLDTVAPLVQGSSRNHIARSRDRVYPLRPELSEYTIEFVPGWWLGTNIANREKIRIIKKACEAAGLSFGLDIIISLPNAS